MMVRARREGSVAVIELDGKLTIGEGDVEMSDAIKRMLDEGSRRFVVDLSRVPYMDSAGLGELMRSNKRVRERGGAIRLVLSAKTREVLTIAAVMPVFDLHPDVPSAIAAFGD